MSNADSPIGHMTEADLAQLTYVVARAVPLTEAQRDAVNEALRREMEIETGKRLDAARYQKAITGEDTRARDKLIAGLRRTQ